MNNKSNKKSNKRNSKKLAVILLAVLALVGSTGAFAFWDQLTAGSDEIVYIGEGVTLTLSDSLSSEAPDARLIPANAVLKPGDIKSVTFTYDVALDQEAVTDLLFEVEVLNVLINGSSQYADLANFEINHAEFINSDVVQVTITLTLTEPADFEAYTAIANQDITFDVLFSSEQQPGA